MTHKGDVSLTSKGMGSAEGKWMCYTNTYTNGCVIHHLPEVVLETVIKKRRLVGKKVDMFQAVRKHTGDHEGEIRWRKKGREGDGGHGEGQAPLARLWAECWGQPRNQPPPPAE